MGAFYMGGFFQLLSYLMLINHRQTLWFDLLWKLLIILASFVEGKLLCAFFIGASVAFFNNPKSQTIIQVRPSLEAVDLYGIELCWMQG